MLSKTDVICLKNLEREGKISIIKSLEIRNFMLVSSGNLNYNTVYKRLEKLKDKGLVNCGFLNKNAKTYYITEEGINILKTIN